MLPYSVWVVLSTVLCVVFSSKFVHLASVLDTALMNSECKMQSSSLSILIWCITWKFSWPLLIQVISITLWTFAIMTNEWYYCKPEGKHVKFVPEDTRSYLLVPSAVSLPPHQDVDTVVRGSWQRDVPDMWAERSQRTPCKDDVHVVQRWVSSHRTA